MAEAWRGEGVTLPVVRFRRPVPALDRGLRRDLRTLATFVSIYCSQRHETRDKSPMFLKTHDVTAIAGREVCLCSSCAKLLSHAFMKRTHCPMDPKPACKHCPNHCYSPTYRKAMRSVMRYSGRRLLLAGRLDYLLHLLF